MTRAVLVAPLWPPESAQNGVTSYVSRLWPALLEAGVDARVVTAFVTPGEEARARRDGVAVVADEPNTPAHYLSNKLLRLRSPDLADEVHGAWRLARVLARLDRARAIDVYEIEEAWGHGRHLVGEAPGRQVVRLHGPWFLCVPAFGWREDDHRARIESEGASIARADAVSSPSRFALEAVRRRYGLPLTDARVIPNATPLAPEPHRWRREGCTTASLLFVGRFDRLKGADTVLEAFGRVHAARPDARLRFAGPDRGVPDGAGGTLDFDAFAAKTLSAEARARVDYLGPLSPTELAPLRAEAEITIVASRFETFGMTVIEALAAGSPIVASRAGAIGELLDWAPELLFEPGDPDALAERLLARLDDPAGTDALAARGLAICAERYAPRTVAELTADFYAGLG